MLAHLFVLLAGAAMALATTGIVVPLYWEPTASSGTASWAPLYTQLAAYPSLPFYLIINPDSGPGSGAQPDSYYQAALTKLRTYKNAKLLGYVHTSYGKRSTSVVTGQVKTYAGWTNKLDGIFFDEVGDGKYTIYDQYYNAVKNTPWANTTTKGLVFLNPGTSISSSYFTIADQIMTFEDTYKSYQSQAPLSLPKPAAQSVIIHSFTGSTSDLSTVTSKLVASKVGSVYITDKNIATEDVYSGFGSDWAQFVSDVAGKS